MHLKWVVIAVASFVLISCVTPPPRNLDNICSIFRQYPHWYDATLDVEARWKVPISVQMAIIHQESRFEATAKPERQKLLWIIPWKHVSTANGYSQALDGTWSNYKRNNGGPFSSRHSFTDAVDFIGWYANDANKRAHIPRSDAYSLYLAYHEGVGGYLSKTYLHKPWLIQVAKKVKTRSIVYHAQLKNCARDNP